MKWFDKWLIQRLKAAHARQAESDAAEMKVAYHNSGASMAGLNTVVAKHPSHELESDATIRFNIFHASGGRVVQTNRYDKQRDRAITGLYVITSDQDFGKEIDKIITMEALK